MQFSTHTNPRRPSKDIGLLLGVTLFSGRPLFAGVSPAFNHLTPPIEITPSLNNTWEDVDTTLLFTAGASGVIVQFENTGVSNTDWGVRPKGSVRAFFTDGAKTNQQGWIMTGTNASGVFQVYSGNTATVRTYIVGYTMSGVKFFTDLSTRPSLPTTLGATSTSAPRPEAIRRSELYSPSSPPLAQAAVTHSERRAPATTASRTFAPKRRLSVSLAWTPTNWPS